MRKIAIINQKGGVGKTTITTNLGHALAMLGKRVTVIDLDPQGQLAASFGIFRLPTKGVDQVLLDGLDLDDAKVMVRDLVSLVPSGKDLRKVEQLHDGGASRGKLLNDSLNGKLGSEDFVLFDCPPSSGVLVANAIFAADEALIPVSGDYLSLNGLARMLATLKRFEPFLKKPLLQWLELSRYIPRRRLSMEVRDKLLNHFQGQLLATPIREAAVMAECPGAGRTIFEYRGSSRSAQEFSDLAADLIEMRAM